MALISKLTIQEVNNRMDAVAIIGDYVRLEKKSGRWWGRCPFHSGGQEKTPSFKVDPDLKMYHCFGCSKGGSVIGFVMEMENLTYPEAIKTLAHKIGVEIIYEEGSDKEFDNSDSSIKEELFELYSRTTVTFRHFLLEKTEGLNALKYLESRGISKEMIDQFQIVFAPAARDFLHNFLKKKGYSDDFLEKSGLFSVRYMEIPLFSDRIMFPITDRQGQIASFGGRAMPGVLQSDGSEPPKYINSPETEIYKKGQTLFAINHAKAEMRKAKCAYLAEGYMDVIALHQAGAANSIAPLGTAFTDEQAAFLHRWIDKLILFFDDDEAGQKAAYKAIITCRKNGLSCELVRHRDALEKETGEIGNIKDPADILQKFGPNILKNILNYTINDSEYLISLGFSKIGHRGSKSQAAEFLFPYLEALDSEVERNDCISKIADAIRIDRNAVLKDYFSWKKEGNKSRTEEKQTSAFTEFSVRRNAELVLLAVVAVNIELYPEFRAALEIKEIDDPAAKELFIALDECFQHGENNADFLLARIKDEPLKNFLISHADSPEFKGSTAIDPRRLMEDGINEIRKKSLRKRSTEINAQLREIERGNVNENTNVDELLEEKKTIDSQIKELKGR
jgi:DNA primase